MIDRRPDVGMTLIELLIVTVLLGLVTTVIAAAFITILRVTPSTEFRIDDARTNRNLQGWLIRDVSSTPPEPYDPVERVGFIDSSGAIPAGHECAPAGIHVLFMGWKDTDTGVTYRSQYTIQGSAATGYEVTRSICGGTTRTHAVSGDVAPDTCAAEPRSLVTLIDSDPDPDIDDATVELCFVSVDPEVGLFQSEGTREVKMSVVSRNGEF